MAIPTLHTLRAVDLVSLRLLLTAIEEGNLAKAATRESISLSAASRRISDLEAELGVKLLRRHDRGVSPTEAAQMALGRIRNIFTLLGQILDDFGDLRAGAKGTIRIGAHHTAIAGMLPKRIAAFLQAHPGVDVRIEDATSADILHWVRTEICDLGLVSGTVDSDGLTLLPWEADQLVAVLPGGHALESREALHFADLLESPFIGLSAASALQTLFRGQAAALGRTLNERALVNSFEGVRTMIQAGLGVGILPAELVSGAGNLSFRPLIEPWANRSLMICLRDKSQLTTASRLLLDFLLSGHMQRQVSS